MARRIGGRALQLVLGACAMALTWACAVDDRQPMAQAAAGNGRQCFLASQVSDFSAVDRDTVLVTVGARTLYELQLFGTCPDINWEQRIGIRSRAGSSWVCRGHDAELLVSSPMGEQRCAVTSVRKLTAPEVEAVRARRSRR